MQLDQYDGVKLQSWSRASEMIIWSIIGTDFKREQFTKHY